MGQGAGFSGDGGNQGNAVPPSRFPLTERQWSLVLLNKS